MLFASWAICMKSNGTNANPVSVVIDTFEKGIIIFSPTLFYGGGIAILLVLVPL